MPTFPSYGKLQLRGYGEKPESAVLRTQMESGPAKQAKTKSRVMVTRPVVYRYTTAELAAFKTWIKDNISRGADWFTWTDPIDGEEKQTRIVGGEFDYKAASAGDGAPLEWDASFRLEAWE